MLALSLLLSAAAGVNAILGGDIKAVKISEETYFCPNNCVYRGAFFEKGGKWCRDNETVILQPPDSAEYLDACAGANIEGWQEYPNDGPAPDMCNVQKSTATDPDLCDSDRIEGEELGTKIVQWSELEKILKSA